MNATKMVIKQIQDELVILDTANDQQFPISLLDDYRIISSPNQIGKRVWDDHWELWTYHIKSLEVGTDVTVFFTN